MNFHPYTLFIVFFLGLGLNLMGCSNNVDYDPPAGSAETAVTHYSFGKMVIDGKVHNGDLTIMPGGKVNSWSFNYDSHEIVEKDFKDLVTDDVKVVIIGLGYNGAAFLTKKAKEWIDQLKARGILIHAMPTSKAVKLFNESSKKGLLACFHLNC